MSRMQLCVIVSQGIVICPKQNKILYILIVKRIEKTSTHKYEKEST